MSFKQRFKQLKSDWRNARLRWCKAWLDRAPAAAPRGGPIGCPMRKQFPPIAPAPSGPRIPSDQRHFVGYVV